VLSALLAAARFGAEDPRAKRPHDPRSYRIALVGVITGALLILVLAGARFTQLIDLATTISFLSAPVLAWITFRVVTDAHMPEAARPGPALRALSWSGLTFLTGFSLTWLGWRLFG
jgi:Mn2+/Fe2+ NRAMP family transporter